MAHLLKNVLKAMKIILVIYLNFFYLYTHWITFSDHPSGKYCTVLRL